MKTLIALLSFVAVAAAIGTQGGTAQQDTWAGTDAFNFNNLGSSGGAAGGSAGFGAGGNIGDGTSAGIGEAMGGSSVDTLQSDGGSDDSGTGSDDAGGSSNDMGSDDSSEDTSGAGGNGLSNLGAMSAQQKSGLAVGLVFAVIAVVAVAGIGYFMYRRRQNGAQMLSNA